MQRDDFKKLEGRVEELIALVEGLRRENEQLRSQHGNLTDRHTRLAEKTRVARERIESMIGRLKALERST